VNTDAAVFVAPTLSMPALTITPSSPLGVGVMSGSFTLDLHLGARASGPATVTLGSFDILDAQRSGAIVPSLEAQSSDVTFPAIVQPDSDVIAHFSASSGVKLYLDPARSQLCDPAGVMLSATIDDSLAGRSTTVYAGPFDPSGCP
jgi:hypothetical protein